MSDWHEIASLADLERDGRVIARIGSREVGVVLDPVENRLVGIRNRCPHQGGPLCLGTVCERAAGVPGRYALEARSVLRCPWHGWEFDLETGVCRDDPALRVAVYPVRVEDGRVLVKA
jgi:nitrite reductase/ring-hydroxylating ferredoxin subunit